MLSFASQVDTVPTMWLPSKKALQSEEAWTAFTFTRPQIKWPLLLWGHLANVHWFNISIVSTFIITTPPKATPINKLLMSVMLWVLPKAKYSTHVIGYLHYVQTSTATNRLHGWLVRHDNQHLHSQAHHQQEPYCKRLNSGGRRDKVASFPGHVAWERG